MSDIQSRFFRNLFVFLRDFGDGTESLGAELPRIIEYERIIR